MKSIIKAQWIPKKKISSSHTPTIFFSMLLISFKLSLLPIYSTFTNYWRMILNLNNSPKRKLLKQKGTGWQSLGSSITKIISSFWPKNLMFIDYRSLFLNYIAAWLWSHHTKTTRQVFKDSNISLKYWQCRIILR